jgi:membrane-bound serine protease (ClpP class)
MSALTLIILLFATGSLVLVAELFIPSHGVLTVLGVGLLIAGIVQTYHYFGQRAGSLATLACLVGLPIFAMAAIKIWPKTWVGRRVAPRNPIITSRDTSVPVDELSRYIGQTGRSITPLRPVGFCEFQGRRVPCIAEFGLIESGVAVEGVRLAGANLAVEQKSA